MAALNYRAPDVPAGEDVLVWDITVPAGAIGVVAALCDGYENELQLRSKARRGPGDYAAWVAPAFRARAEALFAELGARWGVAYAGPRPFSPSDFAAGVGPGRDVPGEDADNA